MDARCKLYHKCGRDVWQFERLVMFLCTYVTRVSKERFRCRYFQRIFVAFIPPEPLRGRQCHRVDFQISLEYYFESITLKSSLHKHVSHRHLLQPTNL